MLVLLSGASGLSGYPISRAAMVGAGTVYLILDRLENLGWVEAEWEVRDDDRPRRRFYRLTTGGRARVLEVLGLREDGHA
jgi:DNA-binding PadR family transcriptional regulator